MAGRAYLTVDGGRRCAKSRCNGWATRSGQFCAGHDVHAQALSRAVIQLKKRGLNLPPLDSIAACKDWFQRIGQALSEDRIKPAKAAELRRIATAFAASDPADALNDRIDALEERLSNDGKG